MYKTQAIVLLFLATGNMLFAQDTVKVRRSGEEDDRNCRLVLCVKKDCYTDSIPRSLFADDKKQELRINNECQTRKKADVFVSSFEISTDINTIHRSSVAQSSFFTGPQLKIINDLQAGEHFNISNVVVHAPDGFRKMENLNIYIK